MRKGRTLREEGRETNVGGSEKEISRAGRRKLWGRVKGGLKEETKGHEKDCWKDGWRWRESGRSDERSKNPRFSLPHPSFPTPSLSRAEKGKEWERKDEEWRDS
jgi:hypothetical protein